MAEGSRVRSCQSSDWRDAESKSSGILEWGYSMGYRKGTSLPFLPGI